MILTLWLAASLLLLIVSGSGMAVSYLAVKQENEALKIENEGLKRLVEPRAQAQLGPYRELTVLHHVLDKEHDLRFCTGRIKDLERRLELVRLYWDHIGIQDGRVVVTSCPDHRLRHVDLGADPRRPGTHSTGPDSRPLRVTGGSDVWK